MEDEIKKWIQKLEGKVDLSRDEDLSICIMNLISLEEHFYYTAMKTENKSYLDMLVSIRKMRQDMMKKIVTDPRGEEWCISKHLLAASMRLFEVGCKEQKNGKSEEYFKNAFDLWSMFFAINLKMIETKKLDKLGNEDKKTSKFSSMIKKIVDCCKEW